MIFKKLHLDPKKIMLSLFVMVSAFFVSGYTNDVFAYSKSEADDIWTDIGGNDCNIDIFNSYYNNAPYRFSFLSPSGSHPEYYIFSDVPLYVTEIIVDGEPRMSLVDSNNQPTYFISCYLWYGSYVVDSYYDLRIGSFDISQYEFTSSNYDIKDVRSGETVFQKPPQPLIQEAEKLPGMVMGEVQTVVMTAVFCLGLLICSTVLLPKLKVFLHH